MTRLTHLAALAASLTALALPVPAMAQGHAGGWTRHHETIASVTPTTLTVTSGTSRESLPMAALRVRAGMYPASTTILRAGESVSVLKSGSEPPLVIVHPAAYGTLSQKGSAWELATKRKGTFTLKTTTQPMLLGMKSLTPAFQAAAFGPVTNREVDVTALTARPLMTRATITHITANQVAAQSDQYGTLTYSLAGLPSRLQAHLAQMKAGAVVVACLNPLNHQVLMMMPDHLERWARALEHGAAGQVVAVSAKDVTLTNPLGTVTIPLRQSTKVQWMGHPEATVQQIPPGTRILVLRHQDASLKIVVLSPNK